MRSPGVEGKDDGDCLGKKIELSGRARGKGVFDLDFLCLFI